MSEIQVASRYAKSLIDLAEEQNALEPIRKDIELFLKTCRENPKLQAILKNPIIGLDKKSNILEGLFADKVHKVILSFFKIVIKKEKIQLIENWNLERLFNYN